MGRELTHREIEELLGAYALDAVDAEEAEAVELHLPGCPRCREEVAGHREAAALLAHVGAPAPEGVWDRIASQLEEPPPALDLAGIVPMTGPSRGTRRRRPLRARVAAAVAVAAIVTSLLGAQVVRQGRRIDHLASAVGRRGLEQAALAAAYEPGARMIELKAVDGQALARAVVLRDGTGYLVERGLPALPAGETYQLWGVTGDRKVSLGVLGARLTVASFTTAVDVRALALTAERAGGVTATDKAPVVLGAVPA